MIFGLGGITLSFFHQQRGTKREHKLKIVQGSERNNSENVPHEQNQQCSFRLNICPKNYAAAVLDAKKLRQNA